MRQQWAALRYACALSFSLFVWNRVITLCMLMLSSADFFHNTLFQTVWVQTVCKDYQQKTKVTTSNEIVSKPVLSGHSKIDKTKILLTNGSLMKVEIIAECSPWSILQYF